MHVKNYNLILPNFLYTHHIQASKQQKAPAASPQTPSKRLSIKDFAKK